MCEVRVASPRDCNLPVSQWWLGYIIPNFWFFFPHPEEAIYNNFFKRCYKVHYKLCYCFITWTDWATLMFWESSAWFLEPSWTLPEPVYGLLITCCTSPVPHLSLSFRGHFTRGWGRPGMEDQFSKEPQPEHGNHCFHRCLSAVGRLLWVHVQQKKRKGCPNGHWCGALRPNWKPQAGRTPAPTETLLWKERTRKGWGRMGWDPRELSSTFSNSFLRRGGRPG